MERKPIRRMDTDEISLDDIRHEVKARAARRWKEIFGGIAAIITALGVGVTGIVKAFGAHDRADLEEYRLEQAAKDIETLRSQLDEARIDLARCCER